jgi:hypothetical protein
MQPAANRFNFADRVCAASEDEKGRLEGIFRVVFVMENMATDAPHQPPVPLHQRGEGVLIAVNGEVLEQLAVAHLVPSLRLNQSLNVKEHGAGTFGGHNSPVLAE